MQRHRPRKRAIQYLPMVLWLLDAPLARGMTGECVDGQARFPIFSTPISFATLSSCAASASGSGMPSRRRSARHWRRR